MSYYERPEHCPSCGIERHSEGFCYQCRKEAKAQYLADREDYRDEEKEE